VIGGDTARADQVVLAVTALGDLAGRAPVLRSGARPGDLVAVAGVLGHAAAGLALLEAGLTQDRLVREHLRPAPPYEAGPEAAGLGATAMIDVSDGLLADLGHIADASGVRIDLDSTALRPDDRLIAAARAVAGSGRHVPGDRTGRVARPSDAEALGWVMTGGEDHSLAATFPAGTRLPPRWTVIGAVTEGSGDHGVVVDGQPWAQAPGWDHFSSLLAGDLAGLDAGRAHIDPLGRAADRDAAALDVRVPAAAGTAV
jgi:thiamine-monophosphate kinase